jgi:hypothetical protein
MGRMGSAREIASGHLGHQSSGHQSSGHQSSGHQSSGHHTDQLSGGTAGVVLRATVETFGPAGEAELNLTVRWPAGVLAAAQTGDVGSDDDDEGNGTDVDGTYDSDGNIRRAASAPSGPVQQ